MNVSKKNLWLAGGLLLSIGQLVATNPVPVKPSNAQKYVYSPNWPLGYTNPDGSLSFKNGYTVISFDALATNDIHIGFSTTSSRTTATPGDDMTEIVLGGWGGTMSAFRTSPQQNAGNQVGGIDYQGKSLLGHFTIMVDQNTGLVTVTGTVDGSGNPITLTHNFGTTLQNKWYFGFSAWNTPITYSNIQYYFKPYNAYFTAGTGETTG